MLYIGIDLGTSACKFLLTDAAGTVLNTVSREYPLSFPQPGWSEQDPAAWWDACLTGIPELLQGFPPEQVAGIGAGGQMHGLVALDGQDNILRPAILWNDGRTWKEVDYLNEKIGRKVLSSRTGNIAFAGFTAPKLLWMRQNEPELFRRIHKIMLPKDYINYRLTGVHSTDYSDASGMLLLDVEHKRWNQEMLELCGLKESQMPTLYESSAPIGTLLPGTARALGLPEKVAVCAGAGDNAAAAVGTGTVGAGKCNISLGTSGTVFIPAERFGVDESNGLHAFAHADGRHPVYFLPYLMGERSPINDTRARGAFLGMGMDTSRASMTLAVLEGVAFAIRDSFEVAKGLGLPISRSTICGGGSKSALWREILANVLGIPLDIVATEQGPGYGGALLSMVACGQFASVEDACQKLVQVQDTVQPGPTLTALYEERYQQFRAIYPACKELFPKLQ